MTTTLNPPKCFINGEESSSSRETTILFSSKEIRRIVHSLLSSSTYFFFYQSRSNCRDLNPSDLTSFHFPSSLLTSSILEILSEELQENLEHNSWFQTRTQKQTGKVKIQSFTSSKSKPIIDQIDTVLAQHYGFTEEELDFIINYDIKYRMGKALFGEAENGEDEED